MDTNTMPMGAAAAPPLDLSQVMNLPKPGGPPQPGQSAPAPQPPAGPQQGGMVGLPQPGAPAQAPFTTETQADGSIVAMSTTQPPVVLKVYPAPKIPVALQQAQQQMQGAPAQPGSPV